MASSLSYYFTSHRSPANVNKKEVDLISPRQEKKLAKKANARAVQYEPEFFETPPFGSKVEEFYSRPVNASIANALQQERKPQNGISAEEEYEQNQKEMVAVPSPGYQDPPTGSLVLERKVPVKLEPKVFLAVERTFLLWMHSSLWLLAAAMTIIAAGYDNPNNLIYGVMILPVALGFVCYSLYQCKYNSSLMYGIFVVVTY